ncbi:hypothetical protein NM208_g3278 [Fusarium decemcellulare]|uniref:Uncharacterized protein n=1 Tax=Fusarium decemcellulare TaxID=57161 RepID=A0ACC1SPI8_9HYPO|nr:hypothetical protein NM208_g3278 [Fusarium decemcellulare]
MADSAPSVAFGSLPDRSHLIAVPKFVHRFLTDPQVSEIGQQFLSSWDRNKQVMWTGNIRAMAHDWALQRGKRTLSVAMGPLMRGAGGGKPTKYMRGASALFAWFITADDVVTILCPPPPERFNPAGRTNMQLVELPILIGMIGGRSVRRIDVIHPMVKDAEDFAYQLWPVDEVQVWIEEFVEATIPRTLWQQRARTSQVRQIEEFLRSISSDSEDDAIYHVVFPRKASAVTATAIVPPQSVEKQKIKDATHLQKGTTPENSEASSREEHKGQDVDFEKKVKEKKEKKPKKKKAGATGDSALSSEGKKAKEQSKIQQQTPGKNIEAKEPPVLVQDTTTLATESLDKSGAINGLRQSQPSTSMATEAPELLDIRDPSTQGEGLCKGAKKKLKKELKRTAKAKRDAEAAADMGTSTTASGARANKAAIRRSLRRAKTKNKQNQQPPQICQNCESERISSANKAIWLKTNAVLASTFQRLRQKCIQATDEREGYRTGLLAKCSQAEVCLKPVQTSRFVIPTASSLSLKKAQDGR